MVREKGARQSYVGTGKRRKHTQTAITEPSHRNVGDKFLVHSRILTTRLIQSSQFLLQRTLVTWLSSSIISVCVWSREGKRCDSGQVGKQVRQGSGVPMVRGRG